SRSGNTHFRSQLTKLKLPLDLLCQRPRIGLLPRALRYLFRQPHGRIRLIIPEFFVLRDRNDRVGLKPKCRLNRPPKRPIKLCGNGLHRLFALFATELARADVTMRPGTCQTPPAELEHYGL